MKDPGCHWLSWSQSLPIWVLCSWNDVLTVGSSKLSVLPFDVFVFVFVRDIVLPVETSQSPTEALPR